LEVQALGKGGDRRPMSRSDDRRTVEAWRTAASEPSKHRSIVLPAVILIGLAALLLIGWLLLR
jgi:hypothetical protein